MNTTQRICNSLISNGLGLWEYNKSNRTFLISDSFRFLLGFENEILTFSELMAAIPEEFHYLISIQQRRLKNKTPSGPLQMPIIVNDNWIWISAQFISEYYDELGALHYIGTVKQISALETKDYSNKSGFTLDVIKQFTDIGYIVAGSETFYDALHQYITGMHNILPELSIAIARWHGGNVFEVVDYTGSTMVDMNYCAINKTTRIYSNWFQCLCETHKNAVINNVDDIGKEWELDKKQFKYNHVKSTVQQPIITTGGEVWGLMSISRKQETRWDNYDQQAISLISNIIAFMVEKFRLSGKLEISKTINSAIRKVCDIYIWEWYCNKKIDDAKEIIVTLQDSKGNRQSQTYFDLANNIHKNDINKMLVVSKQVRENRSKKVALRFRARLNGNKEYHWCEIDGTVSLHDANGKPSLVVGILRDIDKDVKLEIKTKREEKFQKNIYESIPVGIAFYNAKGDLRYGNEKLAEILGVANGIKSIYGTNLFEGPLTTEEMKKQIRQQHITDMVFAYDPKSIASYYTAYKSQPIEIMVRISKLYTDGKFAGYLGIIIDNSLQKSNERKIATLENFFEEIGTFAQLGICWSHQNEGFVSAQWRRNVNNKQTTNALDDPKNNPMIEEEDRGRLQIQFDKLKNNEIQSLQEEVRVLHDDGKVHWINIHIINNNSFGYDGLIGLSIDITQRKENEKTLIEARKKAEGLDLIKSQFIANMSHEIRTPLNAIVGFSEILLKSDTADPDREIYGNIIQTNNDILLKLITDILDLSKIESGTLSLQYKIENISLLCKEVYLSLAPKAPQDVEFTFLPRAENDDAESYCDKTRLIQIITNFINNAFKFTHKGRVMLNYEIANGLLTFHVSDTGIGIPKDQQAHVFDAFVKLDKFTVGSGLGLSICRNLAKQMGGTIGLESTPGKGSHFWLSVPYVTSEDIEAVKDIDGNITDMKDYLEYSKNIIVLEDKPDRLSFITYSLENFNIITAEANGFYFFWLGQKPLMTIIDVESCSGTAAYIISNIRQRGKHYKVIAINNDSSGITDDELLDAGANEIVRLPMDSNDLRIIVHRNLNIIVNE